MAQTMLPALGSQGGPGTFGVWVGGVADRTKQRLGRTEPLSCSCSWLAPKLSATSTALLVYKQKGRSFSATVIPAMDAKGRCVKWRGRGKTVCLTMASTTVVKVIVLRLDLAES